MKVSTLVFISVLIETSVCGGTVKIRSGCKFIIQKDGVLLIETAVSQDLHRTVVGEKGTLHSGYNPSYRNKTSGVAAVCCRQH